MLLFHVGGFLIIYGLMRLQALLPFNPQDHPPSRRICPSTPRSPSSPTPTGRTTAARARCPYLVQMLGLTHQNFLSAATGIALAWR